MKKILVIDDERDVLEIIRSVLKTKGYAVRCAESGEDGLRQAEADPPDLIVCDLMMPRISGLEVIKRLKANETLKHIPIIVVSAVAADSDKPHDYWARGLGVDEYVTKPFDPFDLLGRVEYIFRRGSYVSQNPQPSAAPDSPTPTPAPRTPAPVAPSDLANMPPSGVARAYLEAWNHRDWATEYNCMDDAIMGAYPLEQYASGRTQTYAEEGGGTNRVTAVVEETVSGNQARVVLEYEQTRNQRTTKHRTVVTLGETPKGWKVQRAREDNGFRS